MICRGEEIRKQLVQDYDIKPIMHTILLNGQTLYSDANKPIKREYYIFEYIHKITRDKGTIVCGMGAARHFLELTGSKPLPLFNMLRVCGNASGGNAGIKAAIQWNATAKQLYNAIMILIIEWNAKPGTILYNLKIDVETHMCWPPDANKIKLVNGIIAKDHQKRTVREMLYDFQKAGNDIKDFKFDLLEAILEEYSIRSNF